MTPRDRERRSLNELPEPSPWSGGKGRVVGGERGGLEGGSRGDSVVCAATAPERRTHEKARTRTRTMTGQRRRTRQVPPENLVPGARRLNKS